MKVEERNAAAPSVRADNSSFYAKKGARREVVTGGGDLISAIVNGDVSLDAVPEAEMSPELQALSAAERDAHIAEKSAERSALEAEMADLVQKRDAYIAAEAKTATGDSFDASVKELLAEQLN